MTESTLQSRKDANRPIPSLLEAQKHVLELMVRSAPLSEVLGCLCQIVEDQASSQVRAAILLVAPDGTHLTTGAAPSLPADYTRALDGIDVSPFIGTCAAAAALKHIVVTPDIRSDVGWQKFKHLPLSLGLKAAWSMPIMSADDTVLGTFGTYFTEAREPLASERQLVEVLAPTAALAIEREQSEALRTADLNDTRTMRDLAARLVAEHNAPQLFDEILSAAITMAHADAGTIQLLDDRSGVLTFLATRGFTKEIVAHFSRVDARSGSPCGRALARGERVFFRFDDPQDPDVDGSNRLHLDEGMISAQSTPLISRFGKPVGMFSTHWRRSHRLTERELRFLDLFGRQVADLIERQQAQQSLRLREEQLRLAIDSAEVGLWDVDVVSDTLFWPARVKAMFGISADVPVSMADFYAGLHPADRQRVSEAFAAALDPARRALYDVEYRTVGKEDGVIRWVAAKGRGLFDSSDRCVRVLGTALDITPRKLTEQRLRRRETWLAGQKEAFQAAVRGAPLEVSLGILVRTAVDQFEGQARCAFYVADSEGRTLRHVTGMSEEYARCVDGFKIGEGSLACGLAVHRDQPIVTFDVSQDPRWQPWTWPATQFGYRGCWSFPIETSAGKVVGSIAMYFEEPREATADDRALAAALTQAGGIIISRHQETEARALIASDLQQSESVLRAIFGGTYEYIGLLLPDGTLLEANRASLEFGPSRREDVIGRAFWDTVWFVNTPGAPEKLRDSVRRAAMGEFIRYEAALARPSGEIVTFDFSLHPIKDETGKVILLVPEGRDISALVLARRAIETADRQKDEFLAMLAHELRNPLAPIRNAGEILARTFPESSATQLPVTIIKRQVAQLTKLVDDLLDVSRITQGRIALVFEPVDLTAVVAQAVETFEPQLNERRHKLSVTHSLEFENLHVSGDFARLVQCVSNLLSNAVKYTDPGGEICVRTRPSEADAIIEVTDTGAGIPPELLDRVFDLFVQSDRTLDRAQGGLGVGLAVVRRLVEMHRGQVIARSDGFKKGSSFEIRLPRIPRESVNRTEATNCTVQPRRILIVDDNQDAADSLSMLLKVHGHETHVAYSGEQALAGIEAFMPEVGLLDLGLPEMNGFELAHQLRAKPSLHGLRLIALTGYGQPEFQERTRSAGFADHLVKPIDPVALERAIAGKSARD